jgi:hypothetical protein
MEGKQLVYSGVAYKPRVTMVLFHVLLHLHERVTNEKTMGIQIQSYVIQNLQSSARWCFYFSNLIEHSRSYKDDSSLLNDENRRLL